METIDVLEKPYQPAKDWTDSEWNKFTNWLTGMLKINESVTVTFTKQDGTNRVMNCTLKPELLPVVEVKPLQEGKQPRKESTTSIRVYDLEKKEWRSFTTKNVTRVEFSI
jgi:WYL_2, Sm-like SH3 beta-barrel fold